MTYTNTFIQVAEDCPALHSVAPVPRGEVKPVHVIQYEILTAHPYQYTHEMLVFEVYVRRNAISEQELQSKKEALWAALFQKGHPCMRASELTKKYGWGAHYDEASRIALYGMETDEYKHFVENADGANRLLKAMRSKRA